MSPVMCDLAMDYLSTYLKKIHVKKDVKAWMQDQRLDIIVGDAEEPIKTEFNFDRIVANLVVNLTADAEKMMRSLHSKA